MCHVGKIIVSCFKLPQRFLCLPSLCCGSASDIEVCYLCSIDRTQISFLLELEIDPSIALFNPHLIPVVCIVYILNINSIVFPFVRCLFGVMATI